MGLGERNWDLQAMLFSDVGLVISSPAPEIIENAHELWLYLKSIVFSFLKIESVSQNIIFMCTRVDSP